MKPVAANAESRVSHGICTRDWSVLTATAGLIALSARSRAKQKPSVAGNHRAAGWLPREDASRGAGPAGL